MKTAVRLLLIALLVAACIASESLAAGDRGPTADGWHTWQVAAADRMAVAVSIFCLSHRG